MNLEGTIRCGPPERRRRRRVHGGAEVVVEAIEQGDRRGSGGLVVDRSPSGGRRSGA
jgi:hypothetical protein